MTKGNFFSLLACCASLSRESEIRSCVEDLGIVAGSQAAITDAALRLARDNLTAPCQIALMETTWEKHLRSIELAAGRTPRRGESHNRNHI